VAINAYRLYPLLAVALLAAGTTWLERITRPETPGIDAPSTTPDALINNARVLRYDKQGRLVQQLDAVTMRHYPADGSADLTEPRLELYQEGGQIAIRAAEGHVTAGAEQINLRGAVHATRITRETRNTPLEFDSETLRVRPDEQQAATDDPVVVRQGGSTIHSQSMRSDNIFGTLQFAGSVRSTILSAKTR